MKKRIVSKSKRPSLFKNEKSINKLTSKKEISLSSMMDTNIQSDESFRYDSYSEAIKNTQQLNIDYTKFKNHTFFNSAQAKTNIAISKIINEYPFDQNKKSIESFFDSLTGFENYVFNIFPKYTGYLHFSGTVSGEPASNGTILEIFDSSGYKFPQFSTKNDGNAEIDFEYNPITVEFQTYIPDQVNENQIIIQKQKEAGFGVNIALSRSLDTSRCNIIWSVVSGGIHTSVSSSIEKGKWVNVGCIYDRGNENNLHLFFDGELQGTSSNKAEFSILSFDKSPLYIGTGSIFNIDSRFQKGGESTFSPQVSLSGNLDEVRVFHDVRTADELKEFRQKSIFPEPNLVCYLKFNEPSGSYKGNKIILDSSGNSNHALIQNFTSELRFTGSLSSPLLFEKKNLTPILFPDHYLVKDLNTKMLISASRYDEINPNLITRLIPKHFFVEGQANEGFSTQAGEIVKAITGNSMPGSAKLGSAQLMTSFLLVYAKFFDELKIVIDSISNFLNVNYENEETIPDQLLPALGRYYGIDLPSLFTNADIYQFIDGERLGESWGASPRSLRELQNALWKRFLINIPYITRSKGTIRSIKSTLSSFGIDPDDIVNIREFGGPTKKTLDNKRIRKIKAISFLDFTGSFGHENDTVNYQGYSSTSPIFISKYLSSSRVEPGYPEIKGNFINKSSTNRNGISNNKSDGQHTSGSFTYEAYYRFLEKPRLGGKTHYATQSLARLHVTGSHDGVGGGAHILNILATSASIPTENNRLTLFVRDAIDIATPGLKIQINDKNLDLFNGEPWYISFGKVRSDDIITSVSESLVGSKVRSPFSTPKISTNMTSSWFIRAARSANGRVTESYVSKSFFAYDDHNLLENIAPSGETGYNPSGTFIAIGSQSMPLPTTISQERFLISDRSSIEGLPNWSSGDRDLAMSTKFSGQVGKIRFWSSALDEKSFKDHVRNPDSIGSLDPVKSYDFITQETGSFQRLRVDHQMSQEVLTSSATGELMITNFTQTTAATARGFEKNKQIIKNENIFYSMLSPKFDLSQTDEKVRVRGFSDSKNIDSEDYAYASPVYEVLRSESPDDDTRFAIEFSAIKAVEDDIMSLFSSLEFFDNALGNPNLLFDEFYPDLEQMRKIYFRRLLAKPEFDSYYRMFKWFTSSLGNILEQLVPKKTKFLGIDFIYESHPLERNRFRYLYDEIYLGQAERSFDKPPDKPTEYPDNPAAGQLKSGQIKKF